MSRSLFFAFLIGSSVSASAQIAHGGTPVSWGSELGHSIILPATDLDALDRSVLEAQEPVATLGDFKCGTQRFMDVDVLAAGLWADMVDGGRVCRYALRSPGALMMSVQFGAFHLAPGARVFLYDETRQTFIGAFTSENEQPTGDLATAVLPGDAIVIEYQQPAQAGHSELKVSSIMHGYKDIFHFGERGMLRDIDPGYQSSPCENNVICPVAANWQDQKRSVALFVRPDGGGCSGSLLNNTLQNGKPYFLIANHCYLATESQWVFYFNYDSPTCVGSTGPTTQTVTGAVRRSILYHGDFDLMEINSIPPASYQVYYAGWDRSGAVPQSGAIIEHPMMDVKKIALYSAPATTTATSGEGTPCWQMYMSNGIVESGASGAPLFDQNKRVVGHMIDGPQTCATATTAPSLASKLSANWDGTSAAARLRDWLDPANTSMTLNGYDPNGSTSSTGVRVKLRSMLEGPYVQSAGLMNSTLRDNGVLPLQEPYAALGYVHTGGGGGETTTQTVLNITGTNAIVDWVIIELRSKTNASQVLASRSALMRRDGTITDVDGVSDVFFANRSSDQYYIALRHRNHLAIMTASQQPLSGTGTLINLINGSVGLYGGAAATKNIGGIACMWAGDVREDNSVKYTGTTNDRDPVLSRVGGSVPTSVLSGYYREDVNLDGVVKYTGSNNDRDPILVNVGSLVTSVRAAALP